MREGEREREGEGEKREREGEKGRERADRKLMRGQSEREEKRKKVCEEGISKT